MLVNVNLLDNEHAARNVDLKRKKADYDPYEEMDEEVNSIVYYAGIPPCTVVLQQAMQLPSVLKKYDEEIGGVKRANFELGELISFNSTLAVAEEPLLASEVSPVSLTMHMILMYIYMNIFLGNTVMAYVSILVMHAHNFAPIGQTQ